LKHNNYGKAEFSASLLQCHLMPHNMVPKKLMVRTA